MTTFEKIEMVMANEKNRDNQKNAQGKRESSWNERHIFEIGNGIYFEYLSADEWEVTLENDEIDIDEFMRIASQTVRLIGCMEHEYKDCLRMYLVAKMMFERFL